MRERLLFWVSVLQEWAGESRRDSGCVGEEEGCLKRRRCVKETRISEENDGMPAR